MNSLDAMLLQTPDLNRERLDKLKELFPDLFTAEGKLNPDELKKIVDPELVKETERFEFKWYGKSEAKRAAFTPSRAALVYDKDRSVNPDLADGNMIIEGENLEVMKCLLAAYRERIKCIYIDPPYNVDGDFVYNDRWDESKEDYWEHIGVAVNGVKIDTNSEASGRFHSNWLNMLYPRLLVARQLLRDDGVIFISIDDKEVHHLRKMCDEVFGEENRIGMICWKNVTDNNPTLITPDNEFIVCYARSIEAQPKSWTSRFSVAKDLLQQEFERLKSTGLSIEAIQSGIREFISDNEASVGFLTRYKFVDKDGVYTGSESVHNPRPGGYDFEILHPQTKRAMRKPANGYRFPEKTFREMEAAGIILYGEDEKRIVKIKKYLVDYEDSLRSVISLDGRLGSYELKRLFPGEESVFTNPKPSELLESFISFVTEPNSIVVDFFAGSGSAGHTIFELNRKDKSNRKFILVQLPELTDEKSEVFKAGYKKISDITIERIKRVIQKIEQEEKDKQPDLLSKDKKPFRAGFKVYKLAKSNFPRIGFAPDPTKTEEENIALLKEYINEKEAMFLALTKEKDILDEVLLKNGFMLNYILEKQEAFNKNKVYLVKDAYKEGLICLDMELSMDTVKAMEKHKDMLFICLEKGLNTTKKWNLKHILGDKLSAF